MRTSSARDPARRRCIVLMLLAVVCTRALAGAPELEAHADTIVQEHAHALANGDGTPDRHFHCHSGCGDAPLAVPSVPTMPVVVTPRPTPRILARTAESPTFPRFRPPIG